MVKNNNGERIIGLLGRLKEVTVLTIGSQSGDSWVTVGKEVGVLLQV